MTRVTIHLPEVPVLPRRVRWYFWDTSQSSLLTAKFTQSQSRQIPGTARVGHKRCSHFPSGFTSAGSLGYLQNHVKKRDALGMLAVFLWEDVPQMPFSLIDSQGIALSMVLRNQQDGYGFVFPDSDSLSWTDGSYFLYLQAHYFEFS